MEDGALESMEELMKEARQLHDQNMRKLAAIYFDKVSPAPGITKDDAIAILKEDILRMRAMMKRYGGWSDNDADRT
ncbi:hypothetical protein [Mesorhizobium sp. ISC15]|uniref:hypothetical protein n=1 Tax=Mesorhizobium sp. ISC15 TaxID=3076429 RepID=UPI00301C176A